MIIILIITCVYSNAQDVNSMGAFTYSYPIEIPQGRNGLAPTVSLEYNSQGNNGFLGAGFSIGGLSVITRDRTHAISFNDTTDYFLLDGQRLFKDTQGKFHPERENFNRIEFFNQNASNSYWHVTLKNGTKMHYGYQSSPDNDSTNDGHIDAVGQGGKALLWCLNWVEDTYGNYYLIKYSEDAANGDYYPSQMVYTKNRTSQPAKFVYIDFIYESRTDVIPSYIPTLVKMDKRLSAITVKAETNLIRKYKINYENEPTIGLSRIVSLEEYGTDAAEPTPVVTPAPLPTTKFEWQAGVDGYRSYQTATNVASGLTSATIQDLNGDGFGDWVAAPNTWNFSNGSGFGPTKTTSVLNSESRGYFKDLNGDGIMDWIYLGLGVAPISYHIGGLNQNNEYYLEPAQSGPAVDMSETHFLDDLNGDGLMDFLYIDCSIGGCVIRYYLGNRSTQPTSFYFGAEHWIEPYISTAYPFHLADVNGDKALDLINTDIRNGVMNYMIGHINTNGDFYFAGSGGAIGHSYYPGEPPSYFIDINGDGLADWITLTPYGTVIWNLSTYSGFGPTQSMEIGIGDATQINFMDITNDGYIDIVNNGCYWLGNGAGFGASKPGPSNPTDFMRYGDINGDGLVDAASVVSGQPYTLRYWIITKVNGIGYPIQMLRLRNNNSLISINYIQSTYMCYTDHKKDAYPIIANNDIKFIVCALDLYTIDPYSGSSTYHNYKYFDHMKRIGKPWEREDLGFKLIQDEQGGEYNLTIKKYYRQDSPFEHYIDKNEISSWISTQYNEIIYSYTYQESVVPGVFIIRKTQEDKNIYDGQSTCVTYRTRYTGYDDWGNLTGVFNDGDLSIEKDESETITQYAVDTSNWIFMPSSIVKNGYNLENSWCPGYARDEYFYDNLESNGQIDKGKLTKKRTWVYGSDPDHPVDTRFGYDSTYGSLLWMQDGNMTSGDEKTKEFEYDSTYKILLSNESNTKLGEGSSPVYFETSTGFDDYLRPNTITDYNNSVWSTEYDVYGRIIKKVSPTDDSSNPSTVISYGDNESPRWIKTRTKIQGTTYNDVYQYFDGLGRVIQEKKQAEINGVNGYITTDYFFDSCGRNYKTSVPYQTANSTRTAPDTTQKCTTNQYDVLDRITRTTYSDNTYTQTIYNKKLTTYIDQQLHVKTQEVSGNTVIEKSYTGTYPNQVLYSTVTRKTACDGTKITDNNGNVLRTYLDSAGRKVRYDDPDMGTWTYGYDDNGNLLTQTDAKGQTVAMTYDSLNRITKKDYPGTYTDTVYVYDEDGHGYSKGRLTTVTYGGGSDWYSYDERGRVAVHKKVLDGREQQLSYQYYSNDTVKSITYPGGETVTYALDAGAQVNTVAGTDNYITNVNYTANNKVSSLSYGNGVSTAYDYYDTSSETDATAGTAFSYRLKSMSLSKADYLNMSYQYDKAGNIRIKTDNCNANRSETYVYDDLYRLLTASAADATYGTRNYTYNAINNIVTKEGKTYMYGSVNPFAGPHAVTNDGTYTYVYDTNGNMWTRSDGTTTTTYGYDPDNRLVSITGASTASFGYDAGTARVKKTEGNKTTYYFFSEYEEEYTDSVLSKTIKYYFANGQRVAERSITDGVRYYHTDHLGSSVRMTDTNGNLVRSIGYMPFGGTWYSNGETKYQYTGKEKDASGLYYYGARYYDPELARFTTPDTALDGLNRYTYCYNNPINYNDPSGRWGAHVTKEEIMRGRRTGGNSGYDRYLELTTKHLGRTGCNINGTPQERLAHVKELLPHDIPDVLINNQFSSYLKIWGYETDDITASLRSLSLMMDHLSYLRGGRQNDKTFIDIVSSKYGIDRATVYSDYCHNAMEYTGWEMSKPQYISEKERLLDEANQWLMDTLSGTIMTAAMMPWMLGSGGGGWKFGNHKSATKWANQMRSRGWSEDQINEAITGEQSVAENRVNPGNGATRYTSQTTGKFVIIDDATGELLQISGSDWTY